jgi:hypothetical protein
VVAYVGMCGHTCVGMCGCTHMEALNLSLSYLLQDLNLLEISGVLLLVHTTAHGVDVITGSREIQSRWTMCVNNCE